MAAASRFLLLFALVWGVSLPAVAQEVQLNVPGGEEELIERLRANSLLMPEPDDSTPTSQEIVSAARADYARLVGTLYEFGYFSPVVQILLDGREAANLSPFSVPARIDQIEIRIQPGANYTFGTAEIGPLASGTDLPEEFRPGGAASTPVLQDATGAAIDQCRRPETVARGRRRRRPG